MTISLRSLCDDELLHRDPRFPALRDTCRPQQTCATEKTPLVAYRPVVRRRNKGRLLLRRLCLLYSRRLVRSPGTVRLQLTMTAEYLWGYLRSTRAR